MEKANIVKQMRLFFITSVKALELHQEVSCVIRNSNILWPNKMLELHKMALNELMKNEVEIDFGYIDRLLEQMEDEAAKNKEK